MKAKLSLLETSPSTSQPSKPFQSNKKGLVPHSFNWDKEEVPDNEEMTQVNVLMALIDDELSMGKNHARNGEWIDITMKKGHIREPIWLSHLNFKNINKLAKHNKVLGLPSLVYSKDKPCSAHEKGKHKRASFKTKQNFSIRKCLHLLHMDLFGRVSPMSINHEKYTLVIFDEYLRMVENQNDVKVKQIKTNNRTEFRNSKFESFCNEKGISQNFSSPYTPEQNGVAERKNRTLIEAARTMLKGLVLSKHF
ncbi:retrovirus-related pol polyprotein from transposon TNT 1-94 [Tanacetum coccineum]